MESLISDARSLSWWLGVIGVGIAINLFSAWLGPWLARRAKSTKGFLWHASSRFAENYLSEVVLIKADARYADQILAQEMRCRHQATLYLILGYACLASLSANARSALGGQLFSVFAFLCAVIILLGMRSYLSAELKASQLKFAQRSARES